MTLEKAKELLDTFYERAKGLEYVRDPLAFALYKVWKMADNERKATDERKNC
jgi:hypothetical protein